MQLPKVHILSEAKHILLAVLDWGLGHATRCLPLVKAWRAEGKQVTIAAGGTALTFLRATLPDHNSWLVLPAYAVRYPTRSMVWNLAWQGPRLLLVMWRSHWQVRAYTARHKVDLLVADGRFACWSTQCESVWLAHQLQIQHPFAPLREVLNRTYHAFVRRRYSVVWVPDFAGEDALAGELSKPIARIDHRYLGPLSRYAKSVSPDQRPKYRYLALLSGPEPQRSHLERRVLGWLAQQDVPALLVRGVPGSEQIRPHQGSIEIVDWLLEDELVRVVAESQTIICRSGYSTLMDAWYWQKDLLLIPTPGQTEQLYLADYWIANGKAKLFAVN